MKNRAHRRIAVLAALAIVTFSLPAAAADGDGFTRGNGVIARIGAGAPANLNLGAGIIYDSFHQLGFTANLSWTYCFRIK